MRQKTIFDAAQMAAPPATKSNDGTRTGDTQIEEGQGMALRMKEQIDVDAGSGLMHTVVATAGDVSDVTQPMLFCIATRPLRSATTDIRA